MSKYICTSKNTDKKLICVYEGGKLIEIKAEPHFMQSHITFIANQGLWDEEKIIAYKGINIIIDKLDVTFDDFWDKYAKKVDKPLAVKEWEKLSDSEKSEAYQGINKYNDFCQKERTARKYPCRYLSYKSWKNEY